MKPSGVGGQAVIEGVMMKNKSEYAIAVRKPDGDIEVAKDVYLGLNDKYAIFRLPFFRGIASFIDSLSLGMKTLTYSSSFYDEEVDAGNSDGKREKLISRASAGDEFDIEFVEDADDEDDNPKKLVVREWRDPDENSERSKSRQYKGGKTIVKDGIDYKAGSRNRKESIAMALTMVLSFILAIGIFVILPFLLSELFKNDITSYGIRSLIEGGIRLVLFVLYIKAITLMKDIKRVFMYHGAEHKVINCIEKGKKLNIENARKMPKAHKRCGTSFLLYVVIISIILFVFIQVDQVWLRMLLRIILVPVIAGIAYEFIRLAGRSNNIVVNILSIPGLMLQGLTTKEPDDEMLEVAIASVEAVFDWEAYQDEGRRYDFRRNRIKNIDMENDDASTSVEAKILAERRNRIRNKALKEKVVDEDVIDVDDDPVDTRSADDRTDTATADAATDAATADTATADTGAVTEQSTEVMDYEVPDKSVKDKSFDEETDEILAALDRYFVMDDKTADEEEDDDKP